MYNAKYLIATMTIDYIINNLAGILAWTFFVISGIDRTIQT